MAPFHSYTLILRSCGVQRKHFHHMHLRDMDGVVVCAMHGIVVCCRFKTPVLPSVVGPVCKGLATAPLSIHHGHRRKMGRVSRNHIFFTFYATHHMRIAHHYTCSSTLRHQLCQTTGWYISSSYSSLGWGFKPSTPRRIAVALPLHCNGQERRLQHECSALLHVYSASSHTRSNRNYDIAKMKRNLHMQAGGSCESVR